jgi:hypothetical protein
MGDAQTKELLNQHREAKPFGFRDSNQSLKTIMAKLTPTGFTLLTGIQAACRQKQNN